MNCELDFDLKGCQIWSRVKRKDFYFVSSPFIFVVLFFFSKKKISISSDRIGKLRRNNNNNRNSTKVKKKPLINQFVEEKRKTYQMKYEMSNNSFKTYKHFYYKLPFGYFKFRLQIIQTTTISLLFSSSHLLLLINLFIWYIYIHFLETYKYIDEKVQKFLRNNIKLYMQTTNTSSLYCVVYCKTTRADVDSHTAISIAIPSTVV